MRCTRATLTFNTPPHREQAGTIKSWVRSPVSTSASPSARNRTPGSPLSTAPPGRPDAGACSAINDALMRARSAWCVFRQVSRMQDMHCTWRRRREGVRRPRGGEAWKGEGERWGGPKGQGKHVWCHALPLSMLTARLVISGMLREQENKRAPCHSAHVSQPRCGFRPFGGVRRRSGA